MGKSDERVIEDRDSVEFLQRPHLWKFDACPVKRHVDGREQLGVVPPQGPIVFETLVFMPISPDTPRHQYESYVDLVSDGWEVD